MKKPEAENDIYICMGISHRKSSIHTRTHTERGELWNGEIPNSDITGRNRVPPFENLFTFSQILE